MQFIITEHHYGKVNVCISLGLISDGSTPVLNHLCNRDEFMHFTEALVEYNKGDELQMRSWIHWILIERGQ